jgi:penicillin G amidase
MCRHAVAIMMAVFLLSPSEYTHSEQLQSSTPTYELRGLSNPVEILYDTWGVPHIYADSINDAFFGQGFAAARDRLWQIDWNHRRSLGRMAQLRGPAFVVDDQAARLFTYRGDAEDEWKRYDPRIRPIAIAFASGVNSYVGLVRERPDLLPPEFKRAGYLPEFWDPDDFIRIRGIDAEAALGAARRAQLACGGALDLDRLAHLLEPSWTAKIPEGLDPCSVKMSDLRLLQSASLAFPPGAGTRMITDGAAEQVARSDAQESDPDAREGSNAWVISPHLTGTGRPILANDPHLRMGVPSPRWISHLSAPGLDVIGAGFAGNPGIQNGHNERIAFGRTDFSIDDEDVYVLTTKPDDPDQYLYEGSWRRFQVITETIGVSGGPAVTVKLKYSMAGPIVFESPYNHRAIAVRLTAMEPGAANALQFLASNFSTSWSDFRNAIRSEVFGTNYLYADVDGHIGWHPAGLVPIRPNHDGLLPVPFESRYLWDGMLPLDLLPSEFDPSRGFIANSNQMPFPTGYPYAERKVGFEWAGTGRFNRVMEMLKGKSNFSLAEMVVMQHDVVLQRVSSIVHLLDGVTTGDPKLREAIDLLRSWDEKVDASSAGAALFEVWWSKLSEELYNVIVPSNLKELVPYVRTTIELRLLEHPDERLGPDASAASEDLILTSLDHAIEDLEKKLGTDWTKWTWGALHTVNLIHPFTRLDKASGTLLDVTGGVSGGDTNTVMSRWGSYPNANVTGGSSFSMVLDVGAWDNSVALNSPGQSGDPRSPHYRDLYAPWLNGDVFPLLFTRARIDAVTETRVLLRPAP